MKPVRLLLVLCLIIFVSCLDLEAEVSILPLREQARVIDRWLKIRLETLLPEIMGREKIDMWIVICREYNEDPVFLTLVPADWFSARRLTILVFFDRGKEGVERLSMSRYDVGHFYKGVWQPEQTDQWACLARVVKKRHPRRIGLNESDVFAFADGLSASLKKKLVKALGPEYAARLCSAQNLAVGWLEKRIPQELTVYPQIVAAAHAVIAEAFSNKVITPGITTTGDVEWWMAEKIRSLGLQAWFPPGVDLQRPDDSKGNFSRSGVIQRGDLLHCDVGLTYLRLSTDTQEMAYVLRLGEKDVPPGLKEALGRGNRLQDILTAEFEQGRTGNEILLAALAKAKIECINGAIYAHPLGFHGHGAGPTIGLWDQQRAIPGQGDYPLYYDTCYSIELNVRTLVADWHNQEVRIALEQDALFSNTGVLYLDGRQTQFHIIK